MSFALVLAVAGIALADTIQDDLLSNEHGTRTISTDGNTAGSTTVGYFVQQQGAGADGQSGCNASDGSAANVKFDNLPTGVTASTNQLTFTTCGSTQNVTFSSTTPGTYTIEPSGVVDAGSTATTGTYSTTQASFTLEVKKDSNVTDVSGTGQVTSSTTATANLTAKLVPNYLQETGGLSGRTISFTVTNSSNATTNAGTATTNAQGVATRSSFALPNGFRIAGDYTVTASFAGDATYGDAVGTGTLTVAPQTPACTTPALPVFATSGTDNDGSNGWFTSIPTVSASSPGATITYATEVNGGAKSAYSATAPTLGQGTTKVYAKATNGTCTNESNTTFKVDSVKPGITDGGAWTQALPGNSTTPDGLAGWYVSQVFNKFTATDATSGLVGQTSPYTFTKGSGTSQGAVKINSGVISDQAGNTNNLDSAEYKIDLGAPTGVSGSPDRGPDSNGWYNSSVGFTFRGTDTVSGVVSCSTPTYNGPDGTGKTVNGSCTDAAGNQSTSVASSAIDYDGTAPVIANVGADSTFSTPNAAGWYNTDVRHDFSASDTVSGFGTSGALTLNFYKDISQEGSAVTISSGTVTDRAGNVATAITSSPAYKIDKTAPAANCGSAPSGWSATDVSIRCQPTDGLSGLADTGDADFNLTTSVANGTETSTASTNSRVVADAAGNTVTAGPITNIKVDKKAPGLSYLGLTTSASYNVAGANGWYTSAVEVKFSATDGGSGLAAGVTSPFTKDSGTQEGSAIKVASGTVSDAVGNTAPSVDSAAFKIDLSNPTNVQFSGGPAAGSSHYFGSVPAAPTCTADDAVSGLKDCQVTDYSTAVGTHTMTATATDNAGRTTTATRSYTVLSWTTAGFYQPVDMSTSTAIVWNTVKGGSTVPLKFELFAGSTELTDPANVKSLQSQKVSCSSTGTEDAIETVATGGTSLRYDLTGGQFVYNWKTPTGAGICYKVTVTAQDDSPISAYFKMK